MIKKNAEYKYNLEISKRMCGNLKNEIKGLCEDLLKKKEILQDCKSKLREVFIINIFL